MKLLFINPSLRLGSKNKFLPVGIAYIMTLVKNAGFDFELLDVDVNDFDNTYIENYIKKNQFDVILTGSIVTHYKWMKWLTLTIKKHQPKTKIIVGNSVAGSIPDIFLNDTGGDVAIIGEGEFSTLETLNAIKNNQDLNNVLGIAFKNEAGKIIQTGKRTACNINDLPMIDWELFNTKKYFDILDSSGVDLAWGLKTPEVGYWRTMPVSTARGCVHKCSFCHYVFWNDPYRHRSAESIVQEIRRNVELYGANYINFWDDLSFSSVNQAEKIVDYILESGLKIFWSAAVRSDLFGNPEIDYDKRLRVAKKFKESGCVAVGYSLESGSPEILKMMNKKVKVEYFAEQMKILNSVNIKSNTSVVFGYPIETKKTIAETFEMCRTNKVYPSIGYLLPLPSTGMYKYALENGHITDEVAFLESITERQDLCINMTKFTTDEILSEIKDGAERLNQDLGIGLDSNSLIKTGGYKKHTKLDDENVNRPGQISAPLDPENMKRKENDFSFNYSQQVFDINPSNGNSDGTC